MMRRLGKVKVSAALFREPDGASLKLLQKYIVVVDFWPEPYRDIVWVTGLSDYFMPVGEADLTPEYELTFSNGLLSVVHRVGWGAQ